ncbi:MAG: aminotransferase class V-fold PLP-dependent enzyme [Bacteroidetes bacterium]|nr:aminotransferase class V-fold PLP-dependent enzyme [Fibrella sp.]
MTSTEPYTLLNQLRADTPGCDRVLHFNNAGSALTTRQSLETVLQHLRQEAQIGGYEAARMAGAAIEAVYDSVAALINAGRDEIAIVENATRAWDMVFYAIRFQPGDRILTSVAEYASNYIAYLQIARRFGVLVEAVPNDERGQLSVTALETMIDRRVKLIAITHVPTNGGLVNPAVAIGRVARAAGILYLLDACQSVGQMPIDVQAIGCDMLSATGRKYLRGPRGTGFLYVRRGLLEQLDPPFLDLHAAIWTSRDTYEIRVDARRFETWEGNIAAKLGLGTAVDYALSLGIDRTYSRIVTLAEQLRERLRSINGVTIYDQGSEQCGIVTFAMASKVSAEVRDNLFAQGINVSITDNAHTRLDGDARNLPSMVRASVHYYNTDTEIERFSEAISRLS